MSGLLRETNQRGHVATEIAFTIYMKSVMSGSGMRVALDCWIAGSSLGDTPGEREGNRTGDQGGRVGPWGFIATPKGVWATVI